MVALGVGALPLAGPLGVISLVLNRYRYRLLYYDYCSIQLAASPLYIRFRLLHLCVVVYTCVLFSKSSVNGKKRNDGYCKISKTKLFR